MPLPVIPVSSATSLHPPTHTRDPAKAISSALHTPLQLSPSLSPRLLPDASCPPVLQVIAEDHLYCPRALPPLAHAPRSSLPLPQLPVLNSTVQKAHFIHCPHQTLKAGITSYSLVCLSTIDQIFLKIVEYANIERKKPEALDSFIEAEHFSHNANGVWHRLCGWLLSDHKAPSPGQDR